MPFHEQPMKLHHNRVIRTYTGGKLLDQWQGIVPAADGQKPEEWVASTTTSRYAPDPDTGLSVVNGGRQDGRYLRDVISDDPAGLLGPNHVAGFGENLGFLTKLIDSDKRLNIQTHPTREKAREYFGSSWGKTEAWYIIDTRKIDGEDPYILLGFKPGITRVRWEQLVSDQDIPGLESALHRIPVQPGDVFLVESGIPHAIGSGCLLAEIQEPTDITFRVEKMTNGSEPYPEEVYHQGIGYQKMYDCFHYDGYTRDEIVEKARKTPRLLEKTDGFARQALISAVDTPFFAMDSLIVSDRCVMAPTETFCTAVVVSGSGILSRDGGDLEISRADELFLPFSSSSAEWINTGTEPLEVLICMPPIGGPGSE